MKGIWKVTDYFTSDN